ncbi:MAG TPA: hypothetical protein VHR55_13220 [Candidatus Limnocylindria bacterium]|nr:hypothetical protein [Candidatus Limnocylindria bacterium]
MADPLAVTTRSALRGLRVGDRVPAADLGPMPARRLDATVLVLPGRDGADAYVAGLEAARDRFAEWDGRVRVAEPDGEAAHRVLVVDRYRQVYAVHDATEVDALPDVDELSEWFRFLATACPECGVLDDPLLSGPTP